MSDLMDDINKFAKIWDAALQKGIFGDSSNDVPKSKDSKPAQSDFFGQYLTDEYDRDEPLNEVDSKYWAMVAKQADPLYSETSSKEAKSNTDALGSAHNPIYPNTAGKDQDVNVTPNWAVGGKEIEQLEGLKKELHDLEVKLSSILDERKTENDNPKGVKIQDQIDALKKQVDQLSDSLSGDRFTRPAR